jgi:membrane protein YqaA with SNARE-associated domain
MTPSSEQPKTWFFNRWIRCLYDWMLSWANHPRAGLALFLFAFAESSFFPVPPDVLLIALCMGAHRKWAKFAAIAVAGSVLGAVLGYGIGYFFGHGEIGAAIWRFVGWVSMNDGLELRDKAKAVYDEYGVLALIVAAVTPIPFKVFTILGGFLEQPLHVFIIGSAVGRSFRFFLVAGLMGLAYRFYGDKIQRFVDRYFNALVIVFCVLLVGGFFALKFVKH